MECHGQLHGTQAGTEVARVTGELLDDELPQVVADLLQLLDGQLFKVIGTLYML